ncbi:MBL fold metallo-hydrolase [Desulfuromonas acetoxidans]|uniref:MBL fold metallo-hydrolase n=1 Tax=Desulfuromonas acetoxidans TaxID=891 RepID=UPI00292EA34F|nr:MBL fold metallo-hydrolase [Desulfuromonas acetoxidans]
MKLTILCENTVGRAIPAIGEHGFACWLETDDGSFLIDTGQGFGIIQNARVLEKDLSQFDGVVLSHGHYDHAGGLEAVLRIRGEVPVYAHPDIFEPRFSRTPHSLRFIGIPQRRELLETLGAQFHETPQFQQIAEQVFVTGAIPRTSDFEVGDGNLVQPDGQGGYIADPFADDMAVVVDTPKGLVVILGCAHSGIINTLNYIAEVMQREHFYAVVGGTHLGPVSSEQFELTVAALQGFNIEKIGVSHCTGQARAAQLRNLFPSQFFYGSVGAVLEV